MDKQTEPRQMNELIEGHILFYLFKNLYPSLF